ncbi:CobW family GTP-binding protein [Variovorax sp. PBL-H6]|uniref:CobW family GTP-binding protein n=1 Tax=Variovorax sp. PBL-H6 TaxID=434009 RepID=UPI001E58C9D9|nr:GTP-binding protein [Variovorax sp. PBL-H6]
MNSPSAQRIPVAVITGFLGSGKTTLVNAVLKKPACGQAAVVVSEYGEVGVDHVLIQAPSKRMRLVDGGCMCEYVHEEVAASLLNLLDRRVAGTETDFDRVLIETSGLGDPVPIIQMLQVDPEISRHFELRVVLTMADSLHALQHLDRYAQSIKQVAVADVLVLSKVDVAEPQAVEALSARLRTLNPGARQVRAAHGDLDARLLDGTPHQAGGSLAEVRQWLASEAFASPTADDRSPVRTFSLVHEGEATVPGLVLWQHLLSGFRGAGLLRVKGIVNVEGRPYAVHAVQTIVSEPVPLDQWPDDDRRSRMVFIVRGLDEQALRDTFAALRFEGGRDLRNMVIRPEVYARFRDTISLFRQRAPEPAEAASAR